jgi:hypothetical protein
MPSESSATQKNCQTPYTNTLDRSLVWLEDRLAKLDSDVRDFERSGKDVPLRWIEEKNKIEEKIEVHEKELTDHLREKSRSRGKSALGILSNITNVHFWRFASFTTYRGDQFARSGECHFIPQFAAIFLFLFYQFMRILSYSAM